MEPHAHRLNERTGARGEQTGGDYFFPRQGDVFAHGTVALHAKCLIVLAGVDTRVAAGCAFAAIGVGVDRDGHAGLQSFGHLGTHGLYDGSHLMAGDNRQVYHRVLA